MSRFAAGALLVLAVPLPASAAWQIDQSVYNAYLCQQVRVAAACTAPAWTGNFASRTECESARMRGRLGSDAQWLNRTRCVERPDTSAAKPRPVAPLAGSGAPPREAAGFEHQRLELLAKLKGPGEARPPTAGGALRELQCAAHWALAAARAAGSGAADSARDDAQRSAEAERAPDCPPAPAGAIPIPTPALDGSPPQAAVYRQIIEQAQAIQSRLVKNRAALEATRAQHARTEQALAQLKGSSDADARDDADAQRRAREALAAVEQLERELARLDAQLAESEKEQRALAAEVQALQRRFEAAQARNISSTPEVSRK